MASLAFDTPPPPIAPVVSTPPIEANPLQRPAALSPDASGGTHTFWTTKHLAVIGLGVGVVAAAVVGGALFADAGSADSQAKSLTHDQSCAGSNSPACAQASQLKSRYDGDQVGGGVALGIGGALLVSAVVALIAWPEAEASKSAWVTPVAGPSVAGVEFGGRF